MMHAQHDFSNQKGQKRGEDNKITEEFVLTFFSFVFNIFN